MARDAIEFKDSQMKPETPNASHAAPHFWREMQMEPIKRDKSTSRDFVARGRPLRAKQGSLRSPRGRLVASLRRLRRQRERKKSNIIR